MTYSNEKVTGNGFIKEAKTLFTLCIPQALGGGGVMQLEQLMQNAKVLVARQ